MLVVLDESGTHAGSLGIAVAGFVIEKDRIPILESEWAAILNDHNIDLLHMRDFVPPHGKHSHKTADERRRLFAALIDVIHRNVVAAVGAAIEIDDFMRTTYANALSKEPDLVDSPYHQCVRHCILQVAEWASENGIQDKFTYLIEKGCDGAGKITRAIDGLKTNAVTWQALRIQAINFVSKKDAPVTQCADFLAYEMYKEVDRKVSASPRATRTALISVLRNGDRLSTITSNALRSHLARGAAFIEAQVNYLPPVEQFKVRCYGLRSLTDEQREAIFSALPGYRKLWTLCLASGEMGMRLDEVDRKLLPPDDPKVLFELMKKTVFASEFIPLEYRFHDSDS